MRKSPTVECVCTYCGKVTNIPDYRAKTGRGVYCSKNCYFAGRWGHTGKCHHCGSPAETKFCSPECQKDFWNKHGYVLQKKNRIWERNLELLNRLGGKCVR